MLEDDSGGPRSTPDVTHRTVDVPGARLHVAVQGEGPLVLLLHGFPETWWSWRSQLPALAAAGLRAAAVDLRGCGRSSVPADVTDYRMTALVADAVAVVRALGADTAAVVGHDVGATIAADAALLRPDVFSAVGMLSVPYTPPGGPRPSELFGSLGGQERSYVSHLTDPGSAEGEIEADVHGWLTGFYATLSGDAPQPPGPDGSVFHVPLGGRMSDRFTPGRPSWLSEEDVRPTVADYTRTGLTGALNRYRSFDRDWEDLVAWDGMPLRQPSVFLGGERDTSLTWMADAVAAFPVTMPGLQGVHVLPGAGHWLQQERPVEVNALLVDWLHRLG